MADDTEVRWKRKCVLDVVYSSTVPAFKDSLVSPARSIIQANTKGVSNIERRRWDREEYRKRALEREAKEEADINSRDAFVPAPEGLEGPAGSKRAYLQQRKEKIRLDGKLGKTNVVTETTAKSQIGGYWCAVCKCTLNDSSAYLSHINGKKHQRMLGFSMRVKKASLADVRARFQFHNDRVDKERERKGKVEHKMTVEEYKSKLDAEEAKERERKRRKRERKREKKRRKRNKEEEEESKELTTAPDATSVSSEMLSVMGFAGFGSAN